MGCLAKKPRQWKSMLNHQVWFKFLIDATFTPTTNCRVCNLHIYNLYPALHRHTTFCTSQQPPHFIIIIRAIRLGGETTRGRNDPVPGETTSGGETTWGKRLGAKRLGDQTVGGETTRIKLTQVWTHCIIIFFSHY